MVSSYVPSGFNVIHRLADGGSVVANTFAQTVTQLDARETAALEDGLGTLGPDELAGLLEAGVVVDGERGCELAALRRAYELSKADASHATITVLTTLDCQFACPYCFQERRGCRMGADVQRLVIELVAATADKMRAAAGGDAERAPELSLCFTGGEPLLNIEAILAVTVGAREACEGRGVRLRTTMISNGYLLSPATAAQLAMVSRAWRVQVTVDGDRRTHDSRRHLRNGDPTYDVILDNLARLDPAVFEVSLRVNVDKTNVGSAAEAVASVRALPNVAAYVAPVTVEETQDACTRCSCYTPSEYEAMFKGMARAGLVSTDLERLLERGGVCSAAHPLSCTVDPEGYLYRCFDHAGSPERAYGRLGDPMFENVANERAFLERDPFAEKECADCACLPQCLGSCARSWLDKGTHYCKAVRYLLDDALERLAVA